MSEKPSNVQHAQSALEKFNLDFEYNVSWHEAKKAFRERTVK